ncbi:Transcriptional activator spt7 [Tulasnella sp. 424]|nr:Transcriptional activator spt7 [Tulasnella sp. 424]
MDLGSMTKNVKSGKYKNKADFASDLNLIWDNCLTYNSRPDHPIRRQALYMRKKADHILQRITDKNERPQSVNVRHYKPPPAQHYSKSRTIESSDEEDAGTPLANGRTGHQPNGVMVNGTHGKQVNGITSAPGMVNGTTASDVKKSTVLGKRRFFRPDDTPFLDRPALIRTPESMAAFRDVDIEMQRYMDSEGAGPSRPPTANAVVRHDVGQRVHKKLKTVVAEEPQFLYAEHLGLPLPPVPSDAPQPVYQDPFSANGDIGGIEVTTGQIMGEWWQAMGDSSLQMAGLPTLPQSTDVALSSPRIPRTSARRKNKRSTKRGAADKTPVPGLRGTIERNISTLRRMRKIHAKVNALQAGEEPRRRSPSPPDITHRARRARKGKIPLEGGEHVAKHKMNVFGSMLLEHAGFEGASKAALNVLTAAAADYMMNLGKTLHLYTDKYGQQMTPEEILLHTLFENGTMEVQELERYIKEDVERYGNKITELEKKLSQAYREVELGPIDDALVSDRDALVAGGWGDDLGIDMLGFKEMGLEAELGITAGAIPMRLFWGKKRIGAAEAEETSAEPPPQYPPPPSFIPLSPSNIDPPIGLLQPFYKDRFEKLGASSAAPGPDGSIPQSPSAITLADDSPDPSKVKIGPIGHITIPAASSKPKLPKAPAPPKGPAKKKGSGDDLAGGPNGDSAPSQQAPNPAPAAPAPAAAAPPNGTAAPPPGNNPSPAKRKTKAGKKKATGNAPEAPQAGPMVVLAA